MSAVTQNFHRGEVAVQSRYGKTERMQKIGELVIRDFMPEQHREFFANLPYLLYGATDQDSQPWASLLVGAPGFVHSPEERSLRIDAQPLPGDPIFDALAIGHDMGVLGIDLATRRRNRLNGTLTTIDDQGLGIGVLQSFGNCPRYIQSRALKQVASAVAAPQISRSVQLAASQRSMIRGADTFFIATQYSEGRGRANEGVDVSHRGGKAGFVRVDGEHTLTWPDFSGNFHFNTLGNLELNPRCGLLFLDFARGDLLFLAGTAQVIWDGPEVTGFPGAERLVTFRVNSVIQAHGALPLRWEFVENSRFLESTGTWRESSRQE